MSFPGSVLSQYYNWTSYYWRGGINDAISAVRNYLNNGTNATIRLYIANTSGYGHQVSSVRILRRLAAPANDPIPGFNYAGIIEVAYGDRVTLTKLRNLIPELNGGNEGNINQAAVRLISYPFEPARQLVNVGFTGGADDDLHYAATLNVRYFLRIQPYRWSLPEQVQFNSTKWPYVNLLSQRIIGGATYRQRAYQISQPEINWGTYTGEEVDLNIKRKAKILEWITNPAQLQNYDFCPVYSIRKGANLVCEMGSPASDRIFMLVAGILDSQRENGQAAPNAKPVIIVNLDVYNQGGQDDLGFAYIQEVLGGSPTKFEQPFIPQEWQPGQNTQDKYGVIVNY
ncbi:MAG: hypothetical protein GY869_17770 [Planctomycetes bacterium]|nr:hypothetical protein [Planctomycetota bacterium]